ncbi:ATP-grasp domain-containing protein [Amycolatopsis sp. 195334CR]|nr:ATP-grasp domain-containing protein [Amycolatopsis sp. 195334CR]
MMLLVPSDVLRPRRPDAHFAAEADAARDAGMDVALVDHDALATAGGADEAVRRVPPGKAVYRGWMLSSSRYADFDKALRRRDVVLRTTAAQYRRAHELPGWYADLADITPRTVWTEGAERAAFESACGELGPGPAVLRDYTKSMKHYWHEAAFVPDVADVTAAWAVASRFLELRDRDFTGGFVLRRFENFVSREVRTWWVDGVCRLVGPHPDTPDDLPDADLGVASLVGGLGLPFVTADFALREDGVWRLIELGDGQVSDRPRSVPPGELPLT